MRIGQAAGADCLPVAFYCCPRASREVLLITPGMISLRGAIHEFVVHYHQERNHQGLENQLIISMETTADTALAIEQRQRLGGLLNYYYRAV